MRITNSMLVSNFLNDMNRNLLKNSISYTQLTTGKKMTRISDNPVQLVSAMNARKMMKTYEQYEENVSAARSWIDQSETALRDVAETLSTVYELVVQASSDTNQDIERSAIAKAVKEYRNHIFQSMNTTISGKYIFAGFNATKAPFEMASDGTVRYNGIKLDDAALADPDVQDELNQHFQLEVGVGMKMDVTFTGIEITGVGPGNMFNELNNLIKDLESGKSNKELKKYLTSMENLRVGVMEKVTSIGARTNKLDMLDNRYSQDIINYDSVRGRVEDIDEAEAIMQYKMGEAVYQRALAAGAKIIMPSLLDFVR